MNSQTLRAIFGTGLLFCSAAVSSAALVTFQVDMSTATFDPNTQTVVARGNFTGWGTTFLALTNNSGGANPSLWTGTTNISSTAFPVIGFKYVTEPGDGYESSHNRNLTVPSTGNATNPVAYFNDTPPTPVTVSVTFQVDMAQQINVGNFDPNSSAVVNVRGGFNGWAQDFSLTNDPSILRTNQNGLVTSNVYVYTYDISGSPGQTIDFKFWDTGTTYESPAAGTGDPNDNNNRFFALAPASPQLVPIVFFSDSPYAPKATNATTFQVDMSAQVLGGTFTPGTSTVELRGDMNGWGTPQVLCTNDVTAPNTNLYSAIVSIVDGVGAGHSYKFWSSITANGGWEIVSGNPGINRSFKVVSGTTHILPPVFFSDTTVGDVLTADTTVTISVDMTGAVGTDAHPFNPASDTVYVGGLFLDNLGRWIAPFSVNDIPQQLTNNPVGSMIYSLEYPLTHGSPLPLVYKFGINLVNDEPNGNHVRYVAGTTGSYVLPLDHFGVAVTENAVPNLNVAQSTPGHVLLTWLGRPGIHLQTKASLINSVDFPWVDHSETDGLSSTNWPTSGSASYFRLIKPYNP